MKTWCQTEAYPSAPENRALRIAQFSPNSVLSYADENHIHLDRMPCAAPRLNDLKTVYSSNFLDYIVILSLPDYT